MSDQEPFSPEYQANSYATNTEDSVAIPKSEPSEDVFSTEKLGVAKPELKIIEGILKHD